MPGTGSEGLQPSWLPTSSHLSTSSHAASCSPVSQQPLVPGVQVVSSVKGPTPAYRNSQQQPLASSQLDVASQQQGCSAKHISLFPQSASHRSTAEEGASAAGKPAQNDSEHMDSAPALSH